MGSGKSVIIAFVVTIALLFVVWGVEAIKDAQCERKTCHAFKYEDTKYCENHQFWTKYDAEKAEYYEYLKRPYCGVAKCDRHVEPDGDYCSSHICAIEGCKSPANNGSIYCDGHAFDIFYASGELDKKCDIVGCYSDKFSDYDYCFIHHCRFSGCKNSALSDDGYCEAHTGGVEAVTEAPAPAKKSSSTSKKKKSDPYNASSYSSGTAFADAYYEDFYDYEDDYDDEDEAWDDAYDYWLNHH